MSNYFLRKKMKKMKKKRTQLGSGPATGVDEYQGQLNNELELAARKRQVKRCKGNLTKAKEAGNKVEIRKALKELKDAERKHKDQVDKIKLARLCAARGLDSEGNEAQLKARLVKDDERVAAAAKAAEAKEAVAETIDAVLLKVDAGVEEVERARNVVAGRPAWYTLRPRSAAASSSSDDDTRTRSPSHRTRSPSREKARPPSREKAQSPSRKKPRSPSRKKPRSPSHKKARSPARRTQSQMRSDDSEVRDKVPEMEGAKKINPEDFLKRELNKRRRGLEGIDGEDFEDRKAREIALRKRMEETVQRQNKIDRQKKTRQKKIREEEARQEEARQEEARQKQIRKDKMRERFTKLRGIVSESSPEPEPEDGPRGGYKRKYTKRKYTKRKYTKRKYTKRKSTKRKYTKRKSTNKRK